MEEDVVNPIMELIGSLGGFAPLLIVLGVLGFGIFTLKQNKKRNQAAKQRFKDYKDTKNINKIDIIKLNERTPDLIDAVDRGDYQGGIQRDKIDAILQKEKDVQAQIKDMNNAVDAGKAIQDAWKRLGK